MKRTTLVLAVTCLLSLGSAAYAENNCKPFLATGSYLVTVTGSALVATTPMPIFAPVAGLGIGTLDDSAKFSLASTWTIGGNPKSEDISGTLQVNPDCTVTFKVSCASGCVWEGIGQYLQSQREMLLLITKTNDVPLTAMASLKQVSN